jgi:hypothetical protein
MSTEKSKVDGSVASHCSSCPRCDGEVELDQSGVNGVCWKCGVLWQQSKHKSTRRALLQRDPLKRNQSEELNEALTLISKYCERNLMDGWTIEIQQDNGEQRIALYDPTGNDIESWQYDTKSAIVDCCDCSQEVEAEGV